MKFIIPLIKSFKLLIYLFIYFILFFLDIYDDGKVFVICMTKQQSAKFQKLKYFKIDVAFKCINIKINNHIVREFEITSYIENVNKSKYY